MYQWDQRYASDFLLEKYKKIMFYLCPECTNKDFLFLFLFKNKNNNNFIQKFYNNIIKIIKIKINYFFDFFFYLAEATCFIVKYWRNRAVVDSLKWAIEWILLKDSSA